MARNGKDLGAYQGVNPTERPKTIRARRAPGANDRRFKVGTPWVDEANNAAYMLTSVVAGAANWEILGSPTAAVSTISGDTGGALSPTDGDIILAGGAGVETSGAGSTLTFAVGSDYLAYADVVLTSAQVKALAASPQTLVAAPGAGNVLAFEKAIFKLNYGGTNAFTEAGDNLAIKYTDDTGVAVSQTIEMTGFIDQTADTYTNAEPAIDAIVAAASAENQALVLDNLNAEIAGNAANDNTLSVRVYYRVVAI